MGPLDSASPPPVMGVKGTAMVREAADAVAEMESTPGEGADMTSIAARLALRKRSGRRAKDWFAAHSLHFSMEDLGKGKFWIRNASPDNRGVGVDLFEYCQISTIRRR